MFKLEIGNDAKSAQKFVPVHPNPAIGSNHELSMHLFGLHSAAYKDALIAFTRGKMKILKDRAKSQEIDINDAELTIAEASVLSATMVADCCKSYTGAGDQSNLSDEEKRQQLIDTLASDDYSWLRRGCEKFMTAEDNFFLKPVKK